MIELFTSSTPNGHKVSIMLEETGLAYEFRHIELETKEQKQEWFLKICPNGRIPVIVDHANQGFAVFESGAILLYLAEKSGRFLPSNADQRSRVIQWLMFQMGGVGPMQGQAHVFFRYAPERIDYAVDRYQRETRRLYQVLNRQLHKRDFLVDELSIADFATYPWVRRHQWAGVDIEDLSELRRWLQTMDARPGVRRGLDVPIPQVELKDQTDTAKVSQVRDILS